MAHRTVKVCFCVRGVVSPCLANVFLHYVLDEWFDREVKPRLRGGASLVRYCDDFVVLFAYREDAERVLAVLAKRFEKYGLQLHPEKTRLVEFRPEASAGCGAADGALPTTFDFLGFTHVWGRSRKGNVVVWQFTAKDRFARTLRALNEQCRRMRHWALQEQHQRLCRMLQGHFAYFGITGNYARLARLRYQAERVWRKWLSRRDNEHTLSWVSFRAVLARFALPRPKIVHCYVHW